MFGPIFEVVIPDYQLKIKKDSLEITSFMSYPHQMFVCELSFF